MCIGATSTFKQRILSPHLGMRCSWQTLFRIHFPSKRKKMTCVYCGTETPPMVGAEHTSRAFRKKDGQFTTVCSACRNQAEVNPQTVATLLQQKSMLLLIYSLNSN